MVNKKWVAGWGAATSYTLQNYAEYSKDVTFRYVIFPTIDGEAVRLHFSNRYGEEPATINKVYVAKSAGESAVDISTNVRVTFGGRDELTLEPGAEVVSDKIDFEVKAGQEISVSMYIEGLTKIMTGHSNGGPYIKNYFGRGDWAAAEDFSLLEYGEGGPYAFLHTIDFLTTEDCAAVIAFGDSITAQPWPDCLAHKIYDLGIRNRTIIRKGISGSRVLKEYAWRFKKHWGETGVKRFERDICQAGADRVFVLHGINDIIHPSVTSKYCAPEFLPTAEELIDGYKTYVDIAHKHGKKIYMATILPCPRCLNDGGVKEDIRCKVNEWIRSNDIVDGVIDFEAAVWLEDDHKQLKPEYDSGDHLHPSFAGAAHMADSVPIEFVRD